MAKAIAHYHGWDSYGRTVEVAQREDGQWFERWMEDRGFYGRGMSRWTAREGVKYVTEVTNAYTGEVMQCEDPTARVWWGFNKLDRLDGPHRLRLPKA